MADESEVVSVMRMGWTEEEGDDVEIITIRRLAMIAIAWCVFSRRSLTVRIIEGQSEERRKAL